MDFIARRDVARGTLEDLKIRVFHAHEISTDRAKKDEGLVEGSKRGDPRLVGVLVNAGEFVRAVNSFPMTRSMDGRHFSRTKKIRCKPLLKHLMLISYYLGMKQ